MRMGYSMGLLAGPLACWCGPGRIAMYSMSEKMRTLKHLGVAKAVASPGWLHMGAAVHALRLSQHALHAPQIALYLLLPIYQRLLALHSACSTLLDRRSFHARPASGRAKGMPHSSRFLPIPRS